MTLNDKLNALKDALDYEHRDYLIDILQASRYNAYDEGYKAGLTCFAWWKDGVEYVGNCGTLLKDAVAKMWILYNYSPDTVDLLKERK